VATSDYTIEIHEDSDGSFWGEVRELPGCFGSGWTEGAARADTENAIEVYLEAIAELGPY
jgi:predicted RNase H-like HicB family nuclease